ncbi:MAG: hypothetical protein U5R49_14320 [Deltaproteobacteria bacterium]|nr:hypothetical protein [Deltaproteobacteria bacterium]
MIEVTHILKEETIESSAPCRIDCGGTWDIKALALPLERVRPTTINMALTLRTFVTLSPYESGYVKVSSEGFEREEIWPIEAPAFTSHFGLFLAAVSHFGFHGLRVHIRSQSPVRSALGGSSTALVALIQALSKLAQRSRQQKAAQKKHPSSRVSHGRRHQRGKLRHAGSSGGRLWRCQSVGLAIQPSHHTL